MKTKFIKNANKNHNPTKMPPATSIVAILFPSYPNIGPPRIPVAEG